MKPGGSQRRCASEADPAQDAERRRLPASEQRDDPVEVVDVDLTADVGAAEPELAGRAEHVADRPRRAGSISVGPWRVDGTRDAVPELDREGAIRQGPLDAAPKSIGA